MASVRKLVLGSREVTVEFERKRIRNINVRVRRDGTLYCSLPYYASVSEAEAFIISKQDYLLKSLDSVINDEKTKSLSRQFVDGEVFTILGKPYVLKVLASSKNSCRAEDGVITLEVTDTSDYRTRYMTYEKWRRRCIRSELKFSYRLFEKDREIIRYVVVHEFAHFIEPNHSSRFWAIVADIVPDYIELRKRLNSNASK